MAVTMILLPLLLTETSIVLDNNEGKGKGVKNKGQGKKRKLWKPSIMETMEHFVDAQKVFNIVCYGADALSNQVRVRSGVDC
jgi:hypothetical protein